MWKYEKKLEYPINIKNKDLKMAKALLAQYGGAYTKWDFQELEVFLCYVQTVKMQESELKKVINIHTV